MRKKETHIEGTREGKQTLLAYILVVIVFFLFANYYGNGVEISEAEDLEKALKSQLPVLFVNTVFYIGLSGLILWYAHKYIKHGYWPPPGFPVPFRTRVVKLKHPTAIKISVFLLLALFAFNVGITYYSWFALYRLAHGI